MFEVGSIIAGKYRIDREVGQGGMGSVVAATHLQLGTTVALKYLKGSHLDDDTMKARFLREARACAQLRSEHICRVLDVAEEGGSPYIVMEMLEGQDLNKISKAGPVDPATAVEYVRQACSGLAEAHGRNIVHRDLKPANLFLTHRADGTVLVKVLDFGVAKALDIPGAKNGPRLTGSVHLVGSPAYMSPEQIASSRDVDARTDVWSLGVILYRLIAGRIPFDGNNMAMLAMQIIDAPMPRLPNIGRGLVTILERCLAKDPADRIQSVTELAQLLRPFTGVASVRETDIDILAVPATLRGEGVNATVNPRGPLGPVPTMQLTPSALKASPPLATLKMTPLAKAPAPAPSFPRVTTELGPPGMSSRVTVPTTPALATPLGMTSVAPSSQARAITATPVQYLAPPATDDSPRRRRWVPVVAGVTTLAAAMLVWKITSSTNDTAAAPAPIVAPATLPAPIAAPAPAAVPAAAIAPTPAMAPATTDVVATQPAPLAEPDIADAPPKPTTGAVTGGHTGKPKVQAKSTAKPPKTTESKAETRPVATKPDTKPAPTKPVSPDFGASRI